MSAFREPFRSRAGEYSASARAACKLLLMLYALGVEHQVLDWCGRSCAHCVAEEPCGTEPPVLAQEHACGLCELLFTPIVASGAVALMVPQLAAGAEAVADPGRSEGSVPRLPPGRAPPRSLISQRLIVFS